ncbi:MAG TPA: hypothetical protein DEH78_16720, partial [Solibacterales bacterium]|nr:hypothetical protein [Bryobacterales bacterium]
LLAGAQAIGDRIAKHRGVAAPAAERQMSGRRRPLQAAPWALLVGGVVLLLWLAGAGVASRGRGRRRPAGGFHPGAILGNMLGRPSSPGVSTGGFGGDDSA